MDNFLAMEMLSKQVQIFLPTRHFVLARYRADACQHRPGILPALNGQWLWPVGDDGGGADTRPGFTPSMWLIESDNPVSSSPSLSIIST